MKIIKKIVAASILAGMGTLAQAAVFLDVYNNSNAVIDIQEGLNTALSPLQSATLRPGQRVHDSMWFTIDNLSIAYLATDNRFYKIPGCPSGTFARDIAVDVRSTVLYPYIACYW